LFPTVPVFPIREASVSDPGGPGMAMDAALVAVLANESAEARAARPRVRPNLISTLSFTVFRNARIEAAR
jgi:hypothetical protein